MTMTTRQDFADALETFDHRHGSMIGNALSMYADNMRETAAEAEAAAQLPEIPPEPPRDNGDGTTMISIRPTPAGFTQMARAFREAADKADETATAYGDLINTCLGDPEADYERAEPGDGYSSQAEDWEV